MPVVGNDRQGHDAAAPVTLPELAAWFRTQQQLVLPIAPPTGSPFRQQGYPKALPFEPVDFPLEMRQKLPGLVAYDCPIYPIVLVEDPDTRATVILNMHGEPVHSLPPPPDYNPFAYAQARFPGLGAGAESAALLALYDPARIQIAANLVPAAFYADYLAAIDRLADDLEGGIIIASSPYTSNAALVPGTAASIVSVNTVNGGCTSRIPPSPSTNPLYYLDNGDPENSASDPDSVGDPVLKIEYDGSTILLTAQVMISANVTNHVKAAVADYAGTTDDRVYDSAIFLRAWSEDQCP